VHLYPIIFLCDNYHVNKNNGGLARHESRDYTSWFKFDKEMMIEYIIPHEKNKTMFVITLSVRYFIMAKLLT
jgi:hypothetical protein